MLLHFLNYFVIWILYKKIKVQALEAQLSRLIIHILGTIDYYDNKLQSFINIRFLIFISLHI